MSIERSVMKSVPLGRSVYIKYNSETPHKIWWDSTDAEISITRFVFVQELLDH